MTDKPLKDIHWHGDSLDIIRAFPRPVRVGVWEIRIKDENGAFRVFYVVRRRDGIHVLHAFQKKT